MRYKLLKEILSLIILIIGLTWLIMYIYNIRLNGIEVINGIIWWKEYRIYHSILYIITFILMYLNIKYSYIPLGIDVILGIILFLNEYF